MKPTVLIFGGTGYIGGTLAYALDDANYRVLIFTRKQWLDRKRVECRDIEYRFWDLDDEELCKSMIPEQGACYIVNLAGERISKPWTYKNKKEIVESRTKASSAILSSLKYRHENVHCVINASAIGWYGEHTQNYPCTEDMPASKDFLGQTCEKWEQSTKSIAELGLRLVIFRMGPILGSKGGFLGSIRRVLHWGIAPVFGNGQQIISWIHIQDFVSMILYTLSNPDINGVYNAVSPLPSSQKYIMSVIQRTYYSNTIQLHIPKWLLRLFLGDRGSEVLKSCKVSSEKIMATGFEFKFKSIEKALHNLILEI